MDQSLRFLHQPVCLGVLLQLEQKIGVIVIFFASLRVCVYLLNEPSEVQHCAEGTVEVFGVRVIGDCVRGQNLKKSHVLLDSPHRTEQQLLQTSQTHTLCTYPYP